MPPTDNHSVKSEVLPHPDKIRNQLPMALPTPEPLPEPLQCLPEPPPLQKQLGGELPTSQLGGELPPFLFPPADPPASDIATTLLLSFALGAVFAGALAYSFSKKSCNGCS